MALAHLVKGKSIKIKIIDYDRYNRPVALVYASNKNVNKTLVELGYAWMYSMYCKNEFCADWNRFGDEARMSKSGLWRDRNPIPPWI